MCRRILTQLIDVAGSLDVEKFWGVLCDMLHDMLNKICDQEIQTCKGKLPEFIQVNVVPPPTRSPALQDRISTVRKGLHELTLKLQHWKPHDQTFLHLTRNTITNIRSRMMSFPCEVGNPELTRDSISSFIHHCSQTLLAFEGKKQQQHSYAKIKEWKDKLRLSHTKDKKHVFRWLKGQTT